MDLNGDEAAATANTILRLELALILIQALAPQIKFASLESDDVAVEQRALNELQISRAGVFAFRHPCKASRQLVSGGI